MLTYVTITLKVKEVLSVRGDMRKVGKKIWKERGNKINF